MQKEEVMNFLQKDPEKYWKVKLFDKDWTRSICKCGKHFWSLDSSRKTCGDSSCEEYSFIGTQSKDWDYIETWKQVEKFFKNNGHEIIDRYPVLCRWRPDLFFTVASIINFQRIGEKGIEFNLPKNPLLVPQTCLRFNDIPNIGVTGRHHSSFVMVGQHSIPPKGYWKDECIELDYKMLTEVFGIKPEDITFTEDAWSGGGAFGYSLEYFAKGLELGNAVFTEFEETKTGWKKLENPIIDMGGGLERWAWFLSGKTTSYDSAFGPVMNKMKVDYDKDLFERYSKISGTLDIEESKNMNKMKTNIAKQLKVTEKELGDGVGPKQATYAVADHAKTLLYAINDGGIPSNTSYGFNLRLVLRRALTLIKKYDLPFDLIEVMEWHQKYLKRMNPELKVDDRVKEIIEHDKKKYLDTRDSISRRVDSILKKKIKIDDRLLIQLYDSEGIQPETIKEEANKKDIEVEIPQDFYLKVSEKHMQNEIKEEEKEDLPETENLWHSDIWEFDAKVIKSKDNWVVLDRTAFYPTSGGQEHDEGTINDIEVRDVHRHGNVVYHEVVGKVKEGEKVHCVVDRDRRMQLMAHHDATHIIHGLCHKILGDHIWQNSAHKDVDKARLDITHYKLLTDEELNRIETEANRIVQKNIKITKTIMPRIEAEQKYGFSLYQGGVPTTDEIRVVNINGIDIEGCSGSHSDSTGYLGKIKIINQEKIQDGIVRLTYVAYKAAADYEKNVEKLKTTLTPHIKGLYNKLGLKQIKLDKLNKGFDISVNSMGGYIENITKGFEKLAKENSDKADDFLKTAENTTKKLGKELTMDSMLQRLDNEVGKLLDKVNKEEAKKSANEMRFKKLDTGVRAMIEKVDKDSTHLKLLSEQLSDSNTLIFLLNREGDVFASSGQTASQYYGVGSIAKEMFNKFDGKGGGSPHLAQGKIDSSKVDECLLWLKERIN